jgi:hypothetical protein
VHVLRDHRGGTGEACPAASEGNGGTCKECGAACTWHRTEHGRWLLIHLPSGVRLEMDGACDDPPILCDVLGASRSHRSAQRDKLAKDILKLLILKKAARKPGAPTPRLILLSGDAAAARACRSGAARRWRSA